jgi:WD40 repeat protein
MIAVREACWGTIAIGSLVAVGFWVSKHPEVVEGDLSGAASSNGSSERIVNARRTVWFPQGDRLLTLTTGGGSSNRRLILHDRERVIRELRTDLEGDPASSMSITPDGRYALISTFNGRLLWIDLESDEPMLLASLRSTITTAALSHDGQLAAFSDQLGRIILCPTPLNRESSPPSESEPAGETDWPLSRLMILAQNLGTCSSDIHFSKSDDHLLCTGNDGSLRVWDLPTGQLLQVFRGNRAIVTAAAFLPGTNHVMSACLDDTVRVWDMATGHELWRGQFGCLGVNTLALSPDGKTAAWAGYSSTIYVWNVEQRRMELFISTPISTIWGLRFSPDGKSLAAAAREGTLRIYDAKTGVQQHAIAVDSI